MKPINWQDPTIPLLLRAAAYIDEDIDFRGGCDHSVGICCCADAYLARQLRNAHAEKEKAQ